jgi:hypothetical protein
MKQEADRKAIRFLRRLLLGFGLFTLGALVGLVVTTLTFRYESRHAGTGPGAPPDEKETEVLTLSARIDGSERFVFTREKASLEHGRWERPKQVLLNGEPWEDLANSPPGWEKFARHLDLTRATILQRQGRDIIALEHTEEGFDLFFADTPMGSSDYEVRVSIPRR